MALSWLSITLIAVLLASVYIRSRIRIQSSSVLRDAEAEKPGHLQLDTDLSPSARQLRAKLVAALPHIIISPDSPAAFQVAVNGYWDKKACEIIPACVVRPRNVWELASAVKILKREFDLRNQGTGGDAEGLFAIRGGGHSCLVGASSIKNGVLIDMSLFNQVTPSADGTSAVIGMGCKWIDVYTKLQERGLAVAGGRNSAVGVGGLILGGGLSFFSPRFGFACSNVSSYEVVLADGTITTASETSNADLWRALKGGSNNFALVTNITARCFPVTNIWSGFIYAPAFETSRTISAFHEFLNRVITNEDGKTYDAHAAGPITCFGYIQSLGIHAIAANLVHTSPPPGDTRWPLCWRTSGFAKLWRLWSTCKTRTLASATDEMAILNPPGRRQQFVTTTIKNDLSTLWTVHSAYKAAVSKLLLSKIKKVSITLVLQPVLPDWAKKGDPSPLGLATGPSGPLVNVSFTISWARAEDDDAVYRISREAIEAIDAFAEKHGTGHRYRYLNYCAKWQRPFEGYGEGELEFLREVSRRVDPDGLFQRGCRGGFKLGMGYDEK